MGDLRKRDDAEDAIYRRGAPDTFERGKFVSALARIAKGSEDVVGWPGFDHQVGDPVADQHTFDRRTHRYVFVEGLYVLIWPEARSLFDVKVYLGASVDTCMEALKVRNLAIPGYEQKEMLRRVDAVDRQNAEFVHRSSPAFADVIVRGWSC